MNFNYRMRYVYSQTLHSRCSSLSHVTIHLYSLFVRGDTRLQHTVSIFKAVATLLWSYLSKYSGVITTSRKI